MESFGKTKNIKRLIWPIILLVAVLAIPFTVFIIHVSINTANLQYTLMTILILLVLWFVILRHLHTIYTFAFIQVDENFLVVCDLFSKRKVYNLAKIAHTKMMFKTIYFTHNGWPVLINLHTLSSIELEKFLSLIEHS